MAFNKNKKDEVKRGPAKIKHERKVADPRFGSELLGKLINKVMLDGKKSVAEKIVYGALDMVEERSGKPALEAFNEALEKIKPIVEVKSRRVGGSTYQVPIEVSPMRRTALGLRWMVGHARNRNERTMLEKLANEMLDALQNRGGAAKKREDVHAMAEANKAFAHFRW
jgi:small subunit ribosomal protein S7